MQWLTVCAVCVCCRTSCYAEFIVPMSGYYVQGDQASQYTAEPSYSSTIIPSITVVLVLDLCIFYLRCSATAVLQLLDYTLPYIHRIHTILHRCDGVCADAAYWLLPVPVRNVCMGALDPAAGGGAVYIYRRQHVPGHDMVHAASYAHYIQ